MLVSEIGIETHGSDSTPWLDQACPLLSGSTYRSKPEANSRPSAGLWPAPVIRPSTRTVREQTCSTPRYPSILSDEWKFSFFYRAASTQTVDNFPSASRIIEEKKEEVIPCHICQRNKDKEETTAADMYCYNCDNVFCDEHSGVSKISF